MKKNKNADYSNSGINKMTPYKIFCLIVLTILAILFTFPLYWIITGAFKTPAEINATSPVWFPSEFQSRKQLYLRLVHSVALRQQLL